MSEIKLRLDEDFADDVFPRQPTDLMVADNFDITAIIKYSQKIEQIGLGFNKMTAPLYIRDFSVAYDVTSNMFFEAIRKDMEAGNALELAESLAYLENATSYLETKGIKDTAEARKKYVALDIGVQKAATEKAKTAALVAFLKCKLSEFKTAIESVKKIAYGDLYMTQDE
jgi:hypothetical protein